MGSPRIRSEFCQAVIGEEAVHDPLKVKEVFSDLLLHGSLVLGGSRRNLCVFEEDAVAKLRGSR